MEDGKIIPIKYKVEEGVLNPSTITIKCTDVDGQVNKEELATYTAVSFLADFEYDLDDIEESVDDSHVSSF